MALMLGFWLVAVAVIPSGVVNSVTQAVFLLPAAAWFVASLRADRADWRQQREESELG